MFVRIKFKRFSPYKREVEIFENVTEVHFRYPSVIRQQRVVIEPYGTYAVKHVQELEVFEAVPDKVVDSNA